MKIASKPISSPGRAEKYPPPLMRFLRSNVGSRSRGRSSRSSPMFVRKKNTTTIETQEPSSPKVTCMGQVRVKRSKQSGAPRKPDCIKWIKKVSFCQWKHNTNKKKSNKSSSFRFIWKKLMLLFRVGFRRENKNREDYKIEQENKQEPQNYDLVVEEGGDSVVESICTPPKNALMLMRCRSAPYRSSSLACKFWETEQENNNNNGEDDDEEEEEEEEEEENPILRNESICKDSVQESRMDQENDFEGSNQNETNNIFPIQELKNEAIATVQPVLLTRCKSEPARTGTRSLEGWVLHDF